VWVGVCVCRTLVWVGMCVGRWSGSLVCVCRTLVWVCVCVSDAGLGLCVCVGRWSDLSSGQQEEAERGGKRESPGPNFPERQSRS